MVLPVLGGTPAVWNTCVVFFQGMLLVGYAYSHTVTRYLSVKWQVGLHLVLLAAVLPFLPIQLGSELDVPMDSDPTGWLLTRLVLMLGFPFLIVSSSAPLLQRWFATADSASCQSSNPHETPNRKKGDPYFLYAFSNVGSLAALLLYPFYLETAFDLTSQRWLWFGGYLLLVAGFAACGLLTLTRRNHNLQSTKQPRNIAGNLPDASAGRTSIAKADATSGWLATWQQRIHWLALAMIPSSLMLGVTTYISTDVGSMPLLWVLPLALYLATFILAFGKIQLLPLPMLCRLLPGLLILMAVLLLVDLGSQPWILVAAHLATFFVVAMVCHGELNRLRPPVQRLTEFYLILSIGGFCGGLFNGMLAPALFNEIWEYPLALIAAAWLFPRQFKISPNQSTQSPDGQLSEKCCANSCWLTFGLDLAWPIGLTLSAVVLGTWGKQLLVQSLGLDAKMATVLLLFVVPAILCYRFVDRPLRFTLCYGVLVFSCQWSLTDHNVIDSDRGFFGVNKVAEEGDYRMLINGRTMHGLAHKLPKHKGEWFPLSYYHSNGPVGDIFRLANSDSSLKRVGVVGLGTGSIAAYSRQGQQFDFYEIDPIVARFASEYFGFLATSRGEHEVILGDARVQLERRVRSADTDGTEGTVGYGLLVIDAFSSDAIPSHLLTCEAFELYDSLLKPSPAKPRSGMLAIHITNKHLDLEPLFLAIAEKQDWNIAIRRDNLSGDHTDNGGRLSSVWVVLSKDPAPHERLLEYEGWQPLQGQPLSRPWTDEAHSLLDVLSW